MAGGQDQLKGRIVRVGQHGLGRLGRRRSRHVRPQPLHHQQGGFCGSRDFLEQGLAAYRKALELEPGTPVPYQLHD